MGQEGAQFLDVDGFGQVPFDVFFLPFLYAERAVFVVTGNDHDPGL